MTPERVAEIAESAWVHPQSQPLDVAIERAIRQAVNEALEEAAKAAEVEQYFWSFSKDTRTDDACGKISDAIRALKLSEEP